jgi:hypothetical protein
MEIVAFLNGAKGLHARLTASRMRCSGIAIGCGLGGNAVMEDLEPIRPGLASVAIGGSAALAALTLNGHLPPFTGNAQPHALRPWPASARGFS